MRKISTVALVSVLALGACGAPIAPVIHPEPTFNKLGEGECPEGYTYIPGALFEGTCDPDDDRPPEDDDRDPTDPGGLPLVLIATPIDPQ